MCVGDFLGVFAEFCCCSLLHLSHISGFVVLISNFINFKSLMKFLSVSFFDAEIWHAMFYEIDKEKCLRLVADNRVQENFEIT